MNGAHLGSGIWTCLNPFETQKVRHRWWHSLRHAVSNVHTCPLSSSTMFYACFSHVFQCARWIAEMRHDASAECEAFRGHHRADVTYVATRLDMGFWTVGKHQRLLLWIEKRSSNAKETFTPLHGLGMLWTFDGAKTATGKVVGTSFCLIVDHLNNNKKVYANHSRFWTLFSGT